MSFFGQCGKTLALSHTGWRLYGSTRLPVVEATLSLTGVIAQTVTDEEGIDIYGLIEVKRLPSGVRLRFAEHLAIDLELTGSVAGTYDEKPLRNLVAVYRQRFLLQSGPHLERLRGASAAQQIAWTKQVEKEAIHAPVRRRLDVIAPGQTFGRYVNREPVADLSRSPSHVS